MNCVVSGTVLTEPVYIVHVYTAQRHNVGRMAYTPVTYLSHLPSSIRVIVGRYTVNALQCLSSAEYNPTVTGDGSVGECGRLSHQPS